MLFCLLPLNRWRGLLTSLLTTLLLSACFDKAPMTPTGLHATSENRAVSVSWDTMPDADRYLLYYAAEPNLTEENYRTLANAGVIPAHRPGTRIEGLENDKRYYFKVASITGDLQGPTSAGVSATPTEPIDRSLLSPVSALSRVAANGSTLPDSATEWDCVEDSETGLIWEVKTADGGLRDRNWTYTYYDSSAKEEAGRPAGTANGGMCAAGQSCDTEHYIATLNTLSLCGSSQWRLPTKLELRTIGQDGADNRAISTDWFPNARPLRYWVSAPHTNYSNRAWQLYFSYSHDSYYGKGYNYGVRLVSEL